MTTNPEFPEVPEEGSEAQASGPGSVPFNEPAAETAADEIDEQMLEDDTELTVDDILNAADEANVPTEGEEGEVVGVGDGEPAQDASDVSNDLLNDLKRVQAEYANYRRRTEENRKIDLQRAKADAAKALVPVLDDLDRAAKAGDLTEGTPFASIAVKLRAIAEKQGLEAYGAVGDVFDPQAYEAVFQQPTPGATEMTVLEVVESGYRLGDVELRPAKVVVAVPAG